MKCCVRGRCSRVLEMLKSAPIRPTYLENVILNKMLNKLSLKLFLNHGRLYLGVTRMVGGWPSSEGL